MNPSAWLSTTLTFSRNLSTSHFTGPTPKGLCCEVKSFISGAHYFQNQLWLWHKSLWRHTHPVLSLLLLWIGLYVAAHAGVAGGAVDAGDTVGGVLPADAEVCGLGGSVAWRPKIQASGAADFAPSFAPGFTPKFTHPGTTSYFPLDITCCSQMLGLRSLSRWGPCPLWSVKGELFSFCPIEVRGGSATTPPHLLSWALDTTVCPRAGSSHLHCERLLCSLCSCCTSFFMPLDMPCPCPLTAWQLLFSLPGMLFSLCSAWPALINPSHVTPSLTFQEACQLSWRWYQK